MTTTMQIHPIEKEIYEEYQAKIIPFIVSLEALDCEFPVEILNEIRSIFTHFSVYKLNDCETELQLALRHLQRALLDCHKYVCVSIEERLKLFRQEYQYINLTLADNGNFLPTLNRLHTTAQEALIVAKQFESLQRNASDRTEADSETLYRNYEKAWIAYDKLDAFLRESHEAIAFASAHSKKESLVSKWSLGFGVFGAIGVIFTIWSLFAR